MTKIIIEKKELEAMKDRIDSLLKKAEDKSFPIPTLEPIDESHDWMRKKNLL
jgi:hypothetical protein